MPGLEPGFELEEEVIERVLLGELDFKLEEGAAKLVLLVELVLEFNEEADDRGVSEWAPGF